MESPSQAKKKSVKQKEHSDSLNAFLQPIVARIVEEQMNVYKVSLKDSLLENFKGRNDVSVEELGLFFKN